MKAAKPTWEPYEEHGNLTRRSNLPETVFAFPKQRKEPLTDAQHVRNAVARFGQVIDVSDNDRALAFANIEKAARYYGVDLSETNWHQLGIHPQQNREEAAAKAVETKRERGELEDPERPERRSSQSWQQGSKRAPQPSDNSEFIPYPTNRVVGIIDDEADTQAALRDLKAAGFTDDQIRVLTGGEGAHRINVKGDEHGLLAQIVRSTQKLLGDYEIKHARRHEQELLAGHFGVGIMAHGPEDRDKARQILKAHKGHFINFYGPLMMENLDP